MTWEAQAACRGMDPGMFFPRTATEGKPARRVCAACPVKLECLEAALLEEMPKDGEGIWVNKEGRDGIRGGLNHIERWGLTFPDHYRELKARQRREALAKAARVAANGHPEHKPRTEAQRAARRLRDNYRKLEATG